MVTNNWLEIGGGAGGDLANITIGTIDSQTPSADALVASGVNLYAQSASASNAGVVNTTTQTMAGAKTFSTSVKSPIHLSSTALPASAGVVRLANTDAIKWRNAGNSADLSLSVDASNIFQIGGATTLTGATTVTGAADAVQLTVTGNATQTSSVVLIQKSDATALFSITNAGVTTIGTGTAGQHVLNTLVKTNGASVGTLTNAPSAGNPTGFVQITINGTASYLPYWQ